MSKRNCTETRFSPDDSALVLIDRQSGIMQLVHDYPPAEFRDNVIGLLVDSFEATMAVKKAS